jgi:hypothetical protein
MTLAIDAAAAGPGWLRVALPDPRRTRRPDRRDRDEPPEETPATEAARWPWDARLVGLLASFSVASWGLPIAATLGLFDWLV